MSKFHGIFSPICTPFSPIDQSIEEDKLRNLIRFQIDNGVHGIIPCGGTGEFAALSHDERKRVTKLTVDTVNSKVPVMAHTGACSTWETVELSKHAESIGCDALMIVPPFYEVPTADELVDHYYAISNAVDLPIMVYNIPAHSKINLDPALLSRLVEIPNVQMIKDSTGDLIQFQRILEERANDLIIFNGSDTGSLAGLIHGAKGCVWGVANATPQLCVQLYNLVVEKRDWHQARELWKPLYRLNHFFETEGYAATAKAATAMAGIDIGIPRSPFKSLNNEQISRLESLMKDLGVLQKETANVAG